MIKPFSTKAIGDNGEKIAADYLKKHRYKILEKNYRIKGGETDIIAQDKNGTCIFVEVKFRQNDSYGTGSEAITDYKKTCLIRCAKLYLTSMHMQGLNARFDVIEINGKEINHIVNAFEIN